MHAASYYRILAKPVKERSEWVANGATRKVQICGAKKEGTTIGTNNTNRRVYVCCGLWVGEWESGMLYRGGLSRGAWSPGQIDGGKKDAMCSAVRAVRRSQ